MNNNSAEFELVALKCPQCGAALAAGGSACRHCGAEFAKAVAPEKATDQVVEIDGKKVIGEISFNKWGGLSDSSLAVIAAQIAEKTPKVLMAKPSGERAYTNFTLPLPPKAGRPGVYLAEVFKRDDAGFDVCLSAEFPLKTHQRLRDEGRVLNLPQL